MKRIIILLTGLVIGVAVMAYIYFSKLNTENNAKDLALQSATNNAALIFSFQNDKSFYQIMEGQSLIQQTLGFEKLNTLKQLKASFIDDKIFNAFIKDQQIYISVLPDSANGINFLLTVQIEPDKTTNQFYKQIKNEITPVDKTNNIFKIKLNDSLSVFISLKNQVLTASTSLALVKSSALNNTVETPFTKYIKESNTLNKNILASVYINFNQAPLLLKNILATNLNGELSIFNKQNSFASLNYNFSKERILFNGNTEINEANNFLKLFENTPTQNITINTILPDNTANYTIYAFDDYKNWLNKLRSWQEQKEESQNTENLINTVKTQYRIDLNTIFPLFVKNEFVTFQLSTTEKLAAVSLTNGEKVKQLLLDISADYNDEIRIFKTSDILYSYFGEPFKKFNRPYFTIIDNNLIIANNASTVQSFLNSYKDNKLLIQTPEYLDALNQISNTSTINYYINTKNSTDIFRNNILLPFYKHLRTDSGLKQFDTFYYQMSSNKNKFITNLLLNKYLKTQIPDLPK